MRGLQVEVFYRFSSNFRFRVEQNFIGYENKSLLKSSKYGIAVVVVVGLKEQKTVENISS